MNYRNYHDLIKLVWENLDQIPEVDIVVGIPRSGMIPASVIALQLNKPLLTFDAFLKNEAPRAGERLKINYEQLNNSELKVLIVDDSISTGNELNKKKRLLKKEEIDCDYKFLCVYSSPESVEMPDFYFEVIETPRIFQWNILNQYYLSKSCLDMDGVLCLDPTEEENDDGENYREFCLNAKPLFIPNYKIGHIVTSRLEKFRKETEFWLKKRGVKYGQLHMMQYNDAVERRRANKYGEFKAGIFIETESVMFIESDPKQSKIIHALTNKPVFCTDSMEFYPYHLKDLYIKNPVSLSRRIKLKFLFKQMGVVFKKIQNKFNNL